MGDQPNWVDVAGLFVSLGGLVAVVVGGLFGFRKYRDEKQRDREERESDRQAARATVKREAEERVERIRMGDANCDLIQQVSLHEGPVGRRFLAIRIALENLSPGTHEVIATPEDTYLAVYRYGSGFLDALGGGPHGPPADGEPPAPGLRYEFHIGDAVVTACPDLTPIVGPGETVTDSLLVPLPDSRQDRSSDVGLLMETFVTVVNREQNDIHQATPMPERDNVPVGFYRFRARTVLPSSTARSVWPEPPAPL